MVIGSDLELLKIVLTIICREETHVQEEVIQDYIRRFANRYAIHACSLWSHSIMDGVVHYINNLLWIWSPSTLTTHWQNLPF